MPTRGLLEKPQDARFYHWYLRDPKDTPFCTFQFHYRSWDSLITLQLIPTDYARTLLPASPSLLSLNGYPREMKSPLMESDDSKTDTCIERLAQRANLRDSVSSSTSDTPWMTTVFDDEPDPGAKNPDKPAALFKLPRTAPSYSLRQTAGGPPLSKVAQAALTGINEPGEMKEPNMHPSAVGKDPWAGVDRPLPEIPSRTTSCGEHSRTASGHSNARSRTPSLRSYIERGTRSPQPFIGLASVMHVLASTFHLNNDTENVMLDSALGDERDMHIRSDSESSHTTDPIERLSETLFDVSNATLHQGNHSSPTKLLSPMKQSPLLESRAKKSHRKYPEDFSDDKEGDNGAGVELLSMDNNTATLSWMCRRPSPIRNELTELRIPGALG